MEKKQLKEWVEKLNSDSKSISNNAKKIVIKECEPRLKKWYNCIRKYGDFNISDDDEYLANRGGISDAWFNKETNELSFLYTDGCRGDHIEDDINVDLDEFLDDNFFANREYSAWTKAVTLAEKSLGFYKSKVSETEKLLEKLNTIKPKPIYKK